MSSAETHLCHSLAAIALVSCFSMTAVSTKLGREQECDSKLVCRQAQRNMATIEQVPIEVFQMIAAYTSDQDLAALTRACRFMKHALQDRGFWHIRLLHEFDEPINAKPGIDWLQLYQVRKGLLRTRTDFNTCSKTSIAIISVIKALILEARPQADDGYPSSCTNFAIIKEWIRKTDVIGDLFLKRFTGSANEKRLTQTVLVCLASHFFDSIPHDCTPPKIFGFPEAQASVYSSVAKSPIMTGAGHSTINMLWLLATLHFFRYSRFDNRNLCHNYEDLLCTERPHMWTQQLNRPFNSDDLAKVWRGTYSYLSQDELRSIRALPVRTVPFLDRNFENDNPIQTMKLFVPDQERRQNFNHHLFESVLKSLSAYGPPMPMPQGTKSKAPRTAQMMKSIQHASFPFEGIGWDEENFYATGWINPLPPQNGIPGFARMTMMKYFAENSQIDTSALWAYEGIILPGGQMIIGRWWSPQPGQPDDMQYSGPFILWNVERAWQPEAASHIANHAGLEPGHHGLL